MADNNNNDNLLCLSGDPPLPAGLLGDVAAGDGPREGQRHLEKLLHADPAAFHGGGGRLRPGLGGAGAECWSRLLVGIYISSFKPPYISLRTSGLLSLLSLLLLLLVVVVVVLLRGCGRVCLGYMGREGASMHATGRQLARGSALSALRCQNTRFSLRGMEN